MTQRSDTARLRYLFEDGSIEGFVHVLRDRYEYAYEVAKEQGRDEPTKEDEFDGFRRLLDCAIDGGDKTPVKPPGSSAA